MKFSKRFLVPAVGLALACATTIVIFQNCGGSFEAANLASQGSNGNEGIQSPSPNEPQPLVRPRLASLNFPIAPTGQSRDVQLALVNPFPNLSFSAGRPVFLDHAGDGSNRLFAVFQGGSIEVFENRNSVSDSTTFLDLSSRVASPFGNGGGNEEGLLGLAFDPNYQNNGYFYVYYSAANPRRSVISRFTVSANANVANPNSERILLEVNQPASNHNGGCMRFGPDGYLYIGFGDGGGGNDQFNHGQNRLSYHGTLIRIDPTDGNGTPAYTVPQDNPFVGNSSYLPEIFAFGLRNPWRFSFDRQTGQIWLADVGQSAREEVNTVASGDNLGWPFREGLIRGPNRGTPPAGLKDPILDYPRSVGVSTTGGFVYRGMQFPELQGKYFFGDLNGPILMHDPESPGTTGYTQTGLSAGSLVSFGEDQAGELYVLSFNNGIQRIINSADNSATDADYEPPSLLSETGLFANTENMIPNPGLIPYDVNVPLWSDYAIKSRWIAIPNGQSIRFSSVDNWEFPVGTVTVKHFEIDLGGGQTKRLETRVFVHQNRGWNGYTYRWNESETEATLLTDTETETLTIGANAIGGARTQDWSYPSRSQCMNCHTQAAGFSLGPRTLQLNRNFAYQNRTDNLLKMWGEMGILHRQVVPDEELSFPDWTDERASSENLARAYMDVNCAVCHQAGSANSMGIDLRANISFANMNLNPPRVVPGDAANSDLVSRIGRRSSGQMPPLGTSIVDNQAVGVITNWIDGL